MSTLIFIGLCFAGSMLGLHLADFFVKKWVSNDD